MNVNIDSAGGSGGGSGGNDGGSDGGSDDGRDDGRDAGTTTVIPPPRRPRRKQSFAVFVNDRYALQVGVTPPHNTHPNNTHL